MKQELYHYATSLKSKKLFNVSNVCIWILLTIFLIPLLLSNIWIGLIILFSYLFFYFLGKKEVDKYNKELINLGLFMFFLGVEFSFLILIQYKVIISLVTIILVLALSYEILWLIKIKKNFYSQNISNKSLRFDVFLLIFGGTGIWCGKLMAKNENTDLKLWIGMLLCSILIVGSFSLFQKYFVHKIVNK